MRIIRSVIAWVMWRITYGVMYFFLLFISMEVFCDVESIKKLKKPVIIISNHRSILDPWYISFAIPFSIFFDNIFPLRPYSSLILSEKNVAGRILKNMGVVKFIYFIYNTIDVSDAHSFEEKVAPLISALDEKQSILMFPEGRLVSDDSILEFKKGIVRIYEKTKAPILPIAIKYKKTFFPFYKIIISIGKPIHIPESLLLSEGSSDYKEARDFLRNQVVDQYTNLS